MLSEYEKFLQEQALEKLTKALFEYQKQSLDDDIFFFVPYYFKNFLNIDIFYGKKIKVGYENKIVIANIKKNKYYFEYEIL